MKIWKQHHHHHRRLAMQMKSRECCFHWGYKLLSSNVHLSCLWDFFRLSVQEYFWLILCLCLGLFLEEQQRRKAFKKTNFRSRLPRLLIFGFHINVGRSQWVTRKCAKGDRFDPMSHPCRHKHRHLNLFAHSKSIRVSFRLFQEKKSLLNVFAFKSCFAHQQIENWNQQASSLGRDFNHETNLH